MKVLFTDNTDNILVEILKKNGFECICQPNIRQEEIAGKITDFDGVITLNRIEFDREIIGKSNLKFIARIGAEMDNIDVEFAGSKGIHCFSAPEGYSDAVGEHAVAMLLNLFNNLCRANLQVKNGIWKREANKGLEINGKTIGIIGYGHTGSAFAKKLNSFGVRVLSYDKYKQKYEDDYTTESTIERLFEEADILSLHLPLTEETQYMVNYEFFKKFRKKIYLINTSRGKIVKTDDLSKAIQEGLVLGAALDVLEREKSSFEKLHFESMPDSIEYLIESDSVIMSPHIAGLTRESEYKQAKILAEKIVQIFC